jgi:predicted tellurium resistance membrane protein TerC
MFEWMSDPQAWIALLTLTVMEVVLGIDNVIFISILAGKLPPGQRDRARTIGLAAAMIMRILLLLAITWVMKLTEPLFNVIGRDISGRDLILLFGGLFLIAKSVHEIHDKLEGHDHRGSGKAVVSMTSVIVQIMLLDIVFSLDSVITAVGMAQHLAIMVIAVVLAVIFMLVYSGPVSRFVDKHPTVKMLALSFLILIGVMLVAEAFHQHIPKGYIYFAMAFSVFVEMLNLRLHKKSQPVQLRGPHAEDLKTETPGS